MTLRDILKARNEELEPIITATKKPALPKVEAEKIERVIEGMSNHEKEVAVRKIPTEILQNEISRRLKRDKADLRDIKAIIDRLEEY